MPKELPRLIKIPIYENITKTTETTVTRVTAELDQETLEEILADWLLSASKPFFGHSISFRWVILPHVIVTGEKVS